MKTFDKLNQLIELRESFGEAQDQATRNSISSKILQARKQICDELYTMVVAMVDAEILCVTSPCGDDVPIAMVSSDTLYTIELHIKDD